MLLLFSGEIKRRKVMSVKTPQKAVQLALELGKFK